MKKFLPVLIIGIVIAVGAGIFFYHKKQPQFSGPAQPIRIANVGEYSIFHLIAKQKNIFAQRGLDATVTEYPDGPTTMQALLDGKTDIAVAADFVGVNTLFKHPNIRILAQVSKQKNFQVLGRTDMGIHTPADLKGKTIGLTSGTAGEFFFSKFLEFSNLHDSDVTIVNVKPDQIVTELENGQIAAAVIFDPHAYDIQKKLGDKIVMWSAQGNEDTFGVIYSTNEFISAHPETIARYLQSLEDAEQFTNEHPQDAQAILETTRQYQPDYVQYMWKNFTFAVGIDQELILLMEQQARFLIDKKLTTQTVVPNYIDFMYLDGLRKVQPDDITIQ